jgi:hypothetical protein|tara:strand:+ start:344 stop:562 length:219 start_codon:yes stop_codon:yes gene_type:complete
MGFLNKLLKEKQGKIILSILWGLGLATLFRRVCKGRNCIVIKGPKPKKIDDKIFRFNKKCFQYKSESTSCKK